MANETGGTTATASGTPGVRGSLVSVITTCVLVLGIMLTLTIDPNALGMGNARNAFIGTWVLSGTAHGDDVSHDLDGTILELRDDGTATYAGRDATSLLVPDAGTTATWTVDGSGVGSIFLSGRTFLMTLDGGRLAIETGEGTIIFVRNAT